MEYKDKYDKLSIAYNRMAKANEEKLEYLKILIQVIENQTQLIEKYDKFFKEFTDNRKDGSK